MLKRIKGWDELRGVALSAMIFVHFFYYNSKIYYHFNLSQIFTNIPDPFEFIKGIINLHASYLAPFLFLFIVGIMCHSKFKQQHEPNFRSASKRFLKLYISSLILSLIVAYKVNSLSDIDFYQLPLNVFGRSQILIIIAYVYLINEFVLHTIFKYYQLSITTKMIFIMIFGILIIIFNINTKKVYPTYHSLPIYLFVLSGFFTALLGDLYVTINDRTNKKKVSLLYYILIPAVICIMSAIITKPSLGAIKEMNLIYFMYCFSLSIIIIRILTHLNGNYLFDNIKNILSLMGRHSLGLYLFHFFAGYTIEKLILAKFVPEEYWPINIVFIFFLCISLAFILEMIQNKSIRYAHKTDPTL